MKILSRLLFFVCLPLFLTGCFGSEETPADAVDDSGLVKYTGTGYTLRVPASWQSVESSQITAPVAGKIELAMRSLVSKRGFMNNLVILSDALEASATASEYVSQSMLWASREYLTMKIESDEKVVFADDTTSRLVIFRAKYNEVTEERLFFQTAALCGTTIYLITLGLENDIPADAYDRYRPILSSFSCLS